MKVPNWLYFALVIGGTGGITLLLSFLFFYAFSGFVNSVFYVFLLILAPFFISLPAAYALVSRRIHSPSQRRLLTSIVVTFTGAIMFLSGTTVYFSGIGIYSAFDPAFEILTSLVGFGVMLLGFSFALPEKTADGVLQDISIQSEKPTRTREEKGGYLPAAGVATLIATILTGLVTFLTVPAAMDSCSSNPATCVPTSLIIIGILSSLGVATGIAATSALLMGRYRHTVPFGLTFLSITPLLIIIAWDYWLLLALPILCLCGASIALTAWNQKDSIKTSDLRAIGILSASLGAIALVAGTLQVASGTWNACQGVFVRPYLNNAGLLLSLGASGITFALMSVESARASRGKPARFLLTKQMKVKRPRFFNLLIILLTISLATTTIFAGALVAPFFNQCRGLCYNRVEMIDITQTIFGPSSEQVTFTISNIGTSDVTISQVQVWGAGISNPTSTSQLSTPWICAGKSNNLLVATFPGVTFTSGTTYNFILITSNRNSIPYSTTA